MALVQYVYSEQIVVDVSWCMNRIDIAWLYGSGINRTYPCSITITSALCTLIATVDTVSQISLLQKKFKSLFPPKFCSLFIRQNLNTARRSQCLLDWENKFMDFFPSFSSDQLVCMCIHVFSSSASAFSGLFICLFMWVCTCLNWSVLT